MRTLIKMDEKGRIQIPTKFRRIFKMKPKDMVSMELRDDSLLLKKVSNTDLYKTKMFLDMVVNPGRTKVKVTKKLLDRMDDELWTT